MELQFLNGLDITSPIIEKIIKEQRESLEEWVKHWLKPLTVEELRWVGVEVIDKGMTNVDDVWESKSTHILYRLEKPQDFKTAQTIYDVIHKEDKR